jgi:hypothetical protein
MPQASQLWHVLMALGASRDPRSKRSALLGYTRIPQSASGAAQEGAEEAWRAVAGQGERFRGCEGWRRRVWRGNREGGRSENGCIRPKGVYVRRELSARCMVIGMWPNGSKFFGPDDQRNAIRALSLLSFPAITPSSDGKQVRLLSFPHPPQSPKQLTPQLKRNPGALIQAASRFCITRQSRGNRRRKACCCSRGVSVALLSAFLYTHTPDCA